LIGQFCVFEWARFNNRSFESTDSTNRFRGSKMLGERPSPAAARRPRPARPAEPRSPLLGALGDARDRDYRRALFNAHLVTPSPCSSFGAESLMYFDQSIKILPCFYEQLATQMSKSGLMQAGH
jgi:hypothetical protein